MQQVGGVSCLTQEQYELVRAVIDTWRLWWEPDEPPSRLSPPLMMRGWTIVTSSEIAPLAGVGIRRNGRKVLVLPDGAPLSCQATSIAHTLAHEVLGHTHEIDLMASAGVRKFVHNRDVHPAHDNAAAAAASLMLIPQRFVDSGMSVAEISSWCGVPTAIVVRRLTGTVVMEDTPPGIIRFERRRSTRIWEPENGTLSITGGGSV
jgi:hypothetical protein